MPDQWPPPANVSERPCRECIRSLCGAGIVQGGQEHLLESVCVQAFCDERGAALTREEAGERLARELKLDRNMRMYHRHSDNQTCATRLT